MVRAVHHKLDALCDGAKFADNEPVAQNTFQCLTLDREDGQALFQSPDYPRWREQWQARLDRQTQSREESKKLMKRNNPAMIPRNHLVEDALSYADMGNLSKMHRLLRALRNPYGYTPEQDRPLEAAPARIL